MNNNYTLIRNDKLSILEHAKKNKNIFIFNAMPGAGKTFLAKQAAEKLYKKHIYYQVTTKDKDPIHFCISLHQTAKESIANYKCPELDKLDKHTDILQYETYLKSIIRSLKKYLPKDSAIVIDNADIVPPMGLGCKAIHYAISSASEYLHFYICSRRTCSNPNFQNKRRLQIFMAENDFFKMSQSDFEKTALHILSTISNISGVRKVYTMTEGWFHGTVQILEMFKLTQKLPSVNEIADHMDKYFYENSLISDDAKINQTLRLLSLLDQIHIDFTIQLFKSPKLANFIINAMDNNAFISKNGNNTYIMRPMYKSWLKNQLNIKEQNREIEAIFLKSSERALAKGDIRGGITHLIKGKIYSKLEQIIKNHFPFFMTNEYNDEIYSILSEIPEKILENTPWTATAYAYASINIDPESSYRYFNNAYNSFKTSNNEMGTLYTSAGLVNFMYSSNNVFENNYLEQTEKLYAFYKDMLSESEKVSIASALTYGGMLTMDTKQGKWLIEKAINTAERTKASGLAKQANYVLSVYNEILSNTSINNKNNNILITYLNDLDIKNTRYLEILLKIYRHYTFYTSPKTSKFFNDYIDKFHSKNFNGSRLHSLFKEMYTTEWTMHTADNERLLSSLERQEAFALNDLHPYIAALIWVNQGLKATIDMEADISFYTDKIEYFAKKSKAIDFIQASLSFYIGALYVFTGNFKEANNYLQKSLYTAQTEGNDNIATAASAYISYIYSLLGRKSETEEYASSALRYLKKNRKCKYVWSKPEITQNMLICGHASPATSDHAEKLAFESYSMCFNSTGELINAMYIDSFGEVSLRIGETVMGAEQLSGNFRSMLALLISSNNYTIHQESIQSYLWPESNKEQARRSFDNLMSRFRKLLSDSFYGIDPKDYITISNGIVRLKNVICSADVFYTKLKEAKKDFANDEYTECIDKICTICDLYTDKFLHFITDFEIINIKRDMTDKALIEMMALMFELNRLIPDIFPLEDYLDRWLGVFIKETEMTKLGYKYYINKKDHVNSHSLLKKYETFLLDYGFTQDETDLEIFEIKNSV